MKLKDAFQFKPTQRLTRVIKRFRIDQTEANPFDRGDILQQEYEATLTVHCRFRCYESDYRYTVQTAVQSCVLELYGDFEAFRAELSQRLYEEDYRAAQKLLDEFSAELTDWWRYVERA